MRISDWSSDVCSSDLRDARRRLLRQGRCHHQTARKDQTEDHRTSPLAPPQDRRLISTPGRGPHSANLRSEEHTSELQSLMRSSYAVFCLKKKKHNKKTTIKQKKAFYRPQKQNF